MYSSRWVCCICATCNKPLMSPSSSILPRIFTAMLVVENPSQDPVLSWGTEVVLFPSPRNSCPHLFVVALGWRWECLFFENMPNCHQSPSPSSIPVEWYWENRTILKAWASSYLWSSVAYFLLRVSIWFLEPCFNYGLCQKYLLVSEPYVSLFQWMLCDLLFWRIPIG